MDTSLSIIAGIADKNADVIIERWHRLLVDGGATGGGRIKESEMRTQCRDFLSALNRALADGAVKITDAAFTSVREQLDDVSCSRAAQGFTPTETATFVFSLKEPLFEQLKATFSDDAATMSFDPTMVWKSTHHLP